MSFCKISCAYYPVSEMVVALTTQDKKVLVHKDLAEKCDECGEIHIKEFMYKTQDGHVCEKCFNELGYHVCVDCAIAISHFDSVYKGHNAYVCEDCAENYVRCNFCGELVTRYDEDNNGTIACHNCLDIGQAHRCYDCGCLTDDIYTTADDYDLCQYCYENDTSGCEECGDVYYIDGRVDYDEDEDRYICETCREANGRKEIHDYSYKPSPMFRKLEKERESNEYFGFEIEVEGDRYYAKEFLAKVNKEMELVYLKKDGSVNGFEIVSHPMSRGFFYKEFVPKLTEGMEFLRQMGFRGHNKAGIHIHVSSSSISAKMLKNMVNLMYQNKPEHRITWRKIVQRNRFVSKAIKTLEYEEYKRDKRTRDKAIKNMTFREEFECPNWSNIEDETGYMACPNNTGGFEMIEPQDSCMTDLILKQLGYECYDDFVSDNDNVPLQELKTQMYEQLREFENFCVANDYEI